MSIIQRIAVCLLVFAGLCAAQSYRYMTVTIAAGESLSTAANLNYCSPMRLDVPTKTDGVLSFQLSEDGGATYRDLYDEDGGVVTITASTGNRSIRVNPGDFWNIIRMKIRSGTPSAAVNQTNAITIGIVCQMVLPQ